MSQINVRIQNGSEGRLPQLVIEGDAQALKSFAARINALDDLPQELTISTQDPALLWNGRPAHLLLRQGDHFNFRKSRFTKDIIIAAVIVLSCIFLILTAFALPKSPKQNSPAPITAPR